VIEHTRYLLSAEFKKSGKRDEIKARVLKHIAAHKAAMKEYKE
jgi:hypothetical protein